MAGVTPNQDWVLARWREDAAKDDPALYTARFMHGRIFVWLSIGGNIGWYAPEISNGEMIGLRSEATPQPDIDETPEMRSALNYLFKLVSPKQRVKIMIAVKSLKS